MNIHTPDPKKSSLESVCDTTKPPNEAAAPALSEKIISRISGGNSADLDPNLAKIRATRDLNDQLRRTGWGGRVLVTQALLQQGETFLDRAIVALQTFGGFTAANDPYDEHDFGAFVVEDQSLFFKIDYYAPSMMAGSEDPSDPALCVRILTLMLSSDY
jgi:hypothetical protein